MAVELHVVLTRHADVLCIDPQPIPRCPMLGSGSIVNILNTHEFYNLFVVDLS